MSDVKLNQEIYDLSVNLWYLLADDIARSGGHPGVPGPAGDSEEIYNHADALLLGVRATLKQALCYARTTAAEADAAKTKKNR